jgi:hypothetical protein
MAAVNVFGGLLTTYHIAALGLGVIALVGFAVLLAQQLAVGHQTGRPEWLPLGDARRPMCPPALRTKRPCFWHVPCCQQEERMHQGRGVRMPKHVPLEESSPVTISRLTGWPGSRVWSLRLCAP